MSVAVHSCISSSTLNHVRKHCQYADANIISTSTIDSSRQLQDSNTSPVIRVRGRTSTASSNKRNQSSYAVTQAADSLKEIFLKHNQKHMPSKKQLDMEAKITQQPVSNMARVGFIFPWNESITCSNNSNLILEIQERAGSLTTVGIEREREREREKGKERRARVSYYRAAGNRRIERGLALFISFSGALAISSARLARVLLTFN
jgi:hypothetical protein